MDFEIGEEIKDKELTEIENAIYEFRNNKNYCLKPNELYVIKKQDSKIAPYFLIYPKEEGVKTEIYPIKLNSSYMENLLINDDKKAYLLLNEKNEMYFMILKQKPENLKN